MFYPCIYMFIMIQYTENPNVEKDHSFSFIPTESYLYPKTVKTDKWYWNEWSLSDHRPLVTTFQFKKD